MAKVNRGDPLNITATDYNSFVDAADYVKTIRPNRNTRPTSVKNYTTVTVINKTGAFADRWSAVGVEGIVCEPDGTANSPRTTEYANNAVLKVRIPTDDDKGRWLVLAQSLNVDEVGQAIAFGVAQTTISVTASGDTAVEIEDASAVPVSGKTGYPIIWKESGTGSKNALVLVGGSVNSRELFPVKLTQTGGSAGGGTGGAPNWVYTVKDIDDNELATSVTPLHKRPAVQCLAAEVGTAYYDGTTLKLIWTDEVIDWEACPS